MPRKTTIVIRFRNNKQALDFAKNEKQKAEQLHNNIKNLIRKGELIRNIHRTF